MSPHVTAEVAVKAPPLETIAVVVMLRDLVTGDARPFTCDLPLWDDGSPLVAYWETGNMSCDCNRLAMLYDRPSVEGECGDGRVIVDAIVRRDTGAVIYRENVWG